MYMNIYIYIYIYLSPSRSLMMQKSWHHATWPLAIGVKYTASLWYEAGVLVLLEQCLYFLKSMDGKTRVEHEYDLDVWGG